MRLKKRAAIEAQFNWIFVFIVGAVILLFFVNVVQKQKGLSEQKIQANILTDLDAITTGARVAKGTAQTIAIPKAAIKFSCEDCFCTYSIGESAKQFREKVIFAPERIEGRQMLAWAQDWNTPFRVTNFLLLTSPFIRYIIVWDGASGSESASLLETITAILPDQLTVEVITQDQVGSVQNERQYKTRFVFLNIPGSTIASLDSSFREADISAVNIIGDEQAGNINFFVKKDAAFTKTDSKYLGRASLFGAIFAEDPALYTCQMKSAFARLTFIGDVYQQRTTNLQNHYLADDTSTLRDCDIYYGLAAPQLAQFLTLAGSLSQSFPEGLDQLVPVMKKIALQNNQIQVKSCPELY